MTMRQVVVYRCACGDDELEDRNINQDVCFTCGMRYSVRVVTVSSPELPHPSER
jgi:predicted SprT family Zn-dependent metalloprotease